VKPTDFARGQAWAIPPERFEDLAVQLRDFSLPTTAGGFESLRGAPQEAYEVIEGVAVVPLKGTLLPHADFIDKFFGDAGLDEFTLAMIQAAGDPRVNAILLDVDSPGGRINGTVGAVEIVRAMNQIKPVVALATGDMMSAAYWIASAAQQVVVSKTCCVGSIGVLSMHMDWSEFDKTMGVKRTFLTAGKYKALGNNAEPLGSEARDYFQQLLDHTYGVFVDDVADNRGVSVEKVLADMADARVFIGQQAIDAGLADRLGNMDDAVQLARALADRAGNSNPKRGGMTGMAEKITTIEALAEAYPELVQQARDQAAAGVDTNQARAEASGKTKTDLLALVTAVFGQADGARFQAMVETGVTAEQYQAIVAGQPKPVTDAQAAREGQAQMLRAIQAVGAPDPGTGGPVSDAGQDFDALVKAERTKGKSQAEAVRFVTANFPEAHEAWVAKQKEKRAA
jgi:signal peptide peptidase SppA